MAKAQYVRVYPAQEVTSINRAAEVDPREVGYTQKDVDAIWSNVVKLYETGMNPLIAICLRRDGKVVIDRAIGHARGNAPEDLPSVPKLPARYDTVYNLFSASKAVTAMAVHKLHEKSLAHLDDPVAKFIPEFSRKGKDRISLRHLLTHRAGIPILPVESFNLDLLTDEKKVVEMFCDLDPQHAPGEQLAYHALTSGFIFAEVIRRASGQSLPDFLQKEVMEPIGIKTISYGVPKDIRDSGNFAYNATVGPDTFYPLNKAVEKVLGLPLRDTINLTNDPRFLTGVVPSGNIFATANDVSAFFQMLMNEGELNGERVFEPGTIRSAVAGPTKFERDGMIGIPMRYGMGFMLGGKHYSLFSPDTEHAFGHIGLTNVTAYADPARNITVSMMLTGKCILSPRLFRWVWIMREIGKRTPKVGHYRN